MAETNGKFSFDVIDVHTHLGRLPGHVRINHAAPPPRRQRRLIAGQPSRRISRPLARFTGNAGVPTPRYQAHAVRRLAS